MLMGHPDFECPSKGSYAARSSFMLVRWRQRVARPIPAVLAALAVE